MQGSIFAASRPGCKHFHIGYRFFPPARSLLGFPFLYDSAYEVRFIHIGNICSKKFQGEEKIFQYRQGAQYLRMDLDKLTIYM